MILTSFFNKVRTFVSRSSADSAAGVHGGENSSDGCTASCHGAAFSYLSSGDCDFLFIPPSEIVRGSSDMISELADAIGLTPAQSSEYLEPLVLSYASYVHLLPASERNHHRTPGGLFRHGLETSLLSVQMSRGLVLDYSGSVKQKREMEIRWRAGYGVAGLIHDIGKPVSDIFVRNADGSATWNPFLEPLYEWGKTTDGDRYYLDWQTGRFRRHEHLNLMVLDLVLTRKIRGFLAPDFSREILCSLYNMVTGNYFASSLSRIVTLADQESAKRDLMSARLDASDLSTCIPAERYILEAIIRLMDTGVWTVNQPGARVWVLDSGTYVNWRCAGNIKEILDQAQIPAIPHNPDELALILLERGYAEYCISEREDGEPVQLKFFRIMPDIPGTVEMEALRLTEGAFIFPRVMPPAIRDLLNTGKNGSEATGEGAEASDEGKRTEAASGGTGDVIILHPEENKTSEETAPVRKFRIVPGNSGESHETDDPGTSHCAGSETESDNREADFDACADHGADRAPFAGKEKSSNSWENYREAADGGTAEIFVSEKKKSEDPAGARTGKISAACCFGSLCSESDVAKISEVQAERTLKSLQPDPDACENFRTDAEEKSSVVTVSVLDFAPGECFGKPADSTQTAGSFGGGGAGGNNSVSSGRKSGSGISTKRGFAKNAGEQKTGDLKKSPVRKKETEKAGCAATGGSKAQESASVSVQGAVIIDEERPHMQDDVGNAEPQKKNVSSKDMEDPGRRRQEGDSSEHNNIAAFENSCDFKADKQTSNASSVAPDISSGVISSDGSVPDGGSPTAECEISSDAGETEKLQKETGRLKQKQNQNQTSAARLSSRFVSSENSGDGTKGGSDDFLKSRDHRACGTGNGEQERNSEVSELSRGQMNETADCKTGIDLKREIQTADENVHQNQHQNKLHSGEKLSDEITVSGQTVSSSVRGKNLTESRLAEEKSENSDTRSSEQFTDSSTGPDGDGKLQEPAEEKIFSASPRIMPPEISGVKMPAATGPGSDFLFEQACLLDQGRKIPGFATNTRRIIIIGGLLFRENAELYAHFISERISEQRQGELLKLNLRWSRYIEAVMKRAGIDPVRLPFNIMSSLKISSSLSFLSPDSCQRGFAPAGRNASSSAAGRSAPLNAGTVFGSAAASGICSGSVSSGKGAYARGRSEEAFADGSGEAPGNSDAGQNFSPAVLDQVNAVAGSAADRGSVPAGEYLDKILKKYSGLISTSASAAGEKTVSAVTGKYTGFLPAPARNRSAEEDEYLQSMDELNSSGSAVSSDSAADSDEVSLSSEGALPDEETAVGPAGTEGRTKGSEDAQEVGSENSKKSSGSKRKTSSAGKNTGTKSSSSRYSAKKKAQAVELARINLCLEDLAMKLRSGFFKNASVTARGVETDLQSFFMFVDEYWKDLEHFTVLSHLGMKTVPAGPMFSYRLGNVILKSGYGEY